MAGDAHNEIMKLAPWVALAACVAVAAADVATGSLQGIVKDKATGSPLAGVTVIVTSPTLRDTQTAITDEHGAYSLASLPPGIYVVTFYYADVTLERRNIRVAAGGKVVVATQLIDTARSGGEVIRISGTSPILDQGSTKTGITITQDYSRNIPAGGTFSGATSLGVDAGTSREGYAHLDDNPFFRVAAQPLSTFSIDVDTASYANARRFLTTGSLPPKDAIRIEELINYFHYDDPAPTTSPFSITTEVGPSPWNPQFKLARIGLTTAPIADASVPPRNLVFLIDVSGSMADANKLPLLVQALNLLVTELRPQDEVAIVVYANGTGVVLPSTHGNRKDAIRAALAGLEAGGSTNGAAGITLAYEQARASFIKGGINRVILCTDGDFNVGVTSEGELARLIADERDHDVFLTVLGFGMGNVKDSTMEMLADKGNGNYAYIDSLAEAHKVLVKQAGATLITVAKDVKIQVEMNPAMVAGYRLIGYEDRMLNAQDFNDDKKDAGEIGAGAAVTALYELVPAGVAVPAAKTDRLKYQSTGAPTSNSGELMTVKVRYKQPTGKTSTLLAHAVPDASATLAQTSTDFRWAVAVASYGMLLRDSPLHGSIAWRDVRALASGAIGADREGYRGEFLKLVDAASALH